MCPHITSARSSAWGVPLAPPCDRASTSPVATWLSGPHSTTEASGWGCPLGRTRSRPHSEGAWEPQLVAVSKHRCAQPQPALVSIAETEYAKWGTGHACIFPAWPSQIHKARTPRPAGDEAVVPSKADHCQATWTGTLGVTDPVGSPCHAQCA